MRRSALTVFTDLPLAWREWNTFLVMRSHLVAHRVLISGNETVCTLVVSTPDRRERTLTQSDTSEPDASLLRLMTTNDPGLLLWSACLHAASCTVLQTVSAVWQMTPHCSLSAILGHVAACGNWRPRVTVIFRGAPLPSVNGVKYWSSFVALTLELIN